VHPYNQLVHLYPRAQEEAATGARAGGGRGASPFQRRKTLLYFQGSLAGRPVSVHSPSRAHYRRRTQALAQPCPCDVRKASRGLCLLWGEMRVRALGFLWRCCGVLQVRRHIVEALQGFPDVHVADVKASLDSINQVGCCPLA